VDRLDNEEVRRGLTFYRAACNADAV